MPRRSAILHAAAETFMQDGFAGASMNRIAELAQVSKQTVYAHFRSKEALFIAVIQASTTDAGDRFRMELGEPADRAEMSMQMRAFGERQLALILAPRNIRLAWLVVSEAGRFPQIGRAFYEGATQRDILLLSEALARWASLGLIAMPDPVVAATQFRGLLMSDWLQRILFAPDMPMPDSAMIRARAAETTAAFLFLYADPGAGETSAVVGAHSDRPLP